MTMIIIIEFWVFNPARRPYNCGLSCDGVFCLNIYIYIYAYGYLGARICMKKRYALFYGHFEAINLRGDLVAETCFICVYRMDGKGRLCRFVVVFFLEFRESANRIWNRKMITNANWHNWNV